MTTLPTIVPTFLLRAVDPNAVLEAYLEGAYQQVTEPPGKVLAAKEISLAPSYGQSQKSEIYTYRNKSNNQTVVVTTNHDAYEAVIDGKVYRPSRCLWCRGPIEEEPIGIPVKMTISEGIYYFHLDRPHYCSFECCFAELCLDNKRCVREPLYCDSEQMLRLFFREVVGEEQLTAAPDWWLLEDNGGPLSRQDWKAHHYVRTPSIITLPIKTEYTV